ncbi:MAG: replicative DNA helicase [Ketobacter sp.]|nr:replicative DNA helicase [Ketobacter sp.]
MSSDQVQKWEENPGTKAVKRSTHMYQQSAGAAAVPRAVDVEVCVISAMMSDVDVRDEVFKLITDRDVFYDGKHSAVFFLINQLHSNGQKCGLIEIHQSSEKTGMEKEIGGAYYLTELSDAYYEKSQIQAYCLILLEKYYLRRTINLAIKLKASAMDPTQDPFELIDQYVNELMQIADFSDQQDFQKFEFLLKYIEAALRGDEADMGIGTPWRELNDLLGGLFKTDLVYLAARPGMGKTAIMGDLAVHIAENNIGVGIVSLEMSELQLVKRIASQEAKVDGFHLRMNNLDEEEKTKIKEQMGRLKRLKLWIDDTPGQTIYQVMQKIRKLKRQNPEVEIVFVDYIGLMSDPLANNREQEIAGMSRMLKNLAKELNIVIVCLAQLSRACEGRADKRPMLSDLRDSGGQEQDADVVIFLYRHQYYEPNDPDWKGIAEIIVRKHRHGPIGTVFLTFLEQFAKFVNHAGMRPQEMQAQAEAEERLLETQEKDGL